MNERIATAPQITEAQYDRLRQYEVDAWVSLSDAPNTADRNLRSAGLLRAHALVDALHITERGRAALEAFRAKHGIAAPRED